MDVELEHGTQDPDTNVTDDDVLITAKIARAHLNEFPDYYTRLAAMESEAEAYWAGGGAASPARQRDKDERAVVIEPVDTMPDGTIGFRATGGWSSPSGRALRVELDVDWIARALQCSPG
jgi:hypothetical protein